VAAWAGWEAAVLAAGGWPDTAQNVLFLQTWNTYEQSACANNPLNTTLAQAGSTDCNSAGVQSYPSEAAGAKATVATWDLGAYGAIVDALASGNPFAVPSSAAVAEAITTWGTPNFATWYLAQTAPVSGGAGGTAAGPGNESGAGAGVVAPSAHGGWADLRNSLSRHLPTQLSKSQRIRLGVVRTLAAHSRIRG